MRENRIKQLIKEGKPVVGSALSCPDPFIAEIMGTIGFDFIVIDMEHSPLSMPELQTMMIALRPTESTIIVRVEWNDMVKVKQILDIGAEGIIFPWINNAEEAQQAVATTKYPPVGTRGFGPRRAGIIHGGVPEYAKQANDNILVLGQIEQVEAVDRLDEILPIPGFDGVMVGPADLTLSMGQLPGTVPEETDAMIGRVLDKCKEHGVAFGMFTGTFDVAEKWIERGGQIATVGADALFVLNGAIEAKENIDGLLANKR